MNYDDSYLSSDSSLEIGNRASWHWLASVLSLGRDLVNFLDLLPGEIPSRPVAVMLDLTLDHKQQTTASCARVCTKCFAGGRSTCAPSGQLLTTRTAHSPCRPCALTRCSRASYALMTCSPSGRHPSRRALAVPLASTKTVRCSSVRLPPCYAAHHDSGAPCVWFVSMLDELRELVHGMHNSRWDRGVDSQLLGSLSEGGCSCAGKKGKDSGAQGERHAPRHEFSGRVPKRTKQ